MGELTMIDLFAGVGGFRFAFERQHGVECVFSSEWDKFAAKTYEANWDEVPFGDINEIDPSDIPDHDVLTAGFPCPAFSIAGVSKRNSLGYLHGFEGVQGELFFNVRDVLAAKRPRMFLLENVKNLLTHDKGNTFEVIKHTLVEELGYHIWYDILNSRSLVPQDRKRIFIVGFRDAADEPFFEPPVLDGPDRKLSEILLTPEAIGPQFTLTDRTWGFLQDYRRKHEAAGNGFGYTICSPDGVSRTLSARYHKDGSEILVAQDGKNPRRLTPRECARLMGYPDDFALPCSATQTYKQMGNSVVVPVAEKVAASMVKAVKVRDAATV